MKYGKGLDKKESDTTFGMCENLDGRMRPRDKGLRCVEPVDEQIYKHIKTIYKMKALSFRVGKSLCCRVGLNEVNVSGKSHCISCGIQFVRSLPPCSNENWFSENPKFCSIVEKGNIGCFTCIIAKQLVVLVEDRRFLSMSALQAIFHVPKTVHNSVTLQICEELIGKVGAIKTNTEN